MAEVIYSDEAFTDFESIVELLLATAPEAAAQALESIRSAIGVLEAHSFIGRRVDDHIRELVISRGTTGYLALYRFDPVFDVVRILRGRHQREAGYEE
jgi:plasmid stabilization system protein ParE